MRPYHLKTALEDTTIDLDSVVEITSISYQGSLQRRWSFIVFFDGGTQPRTFAVTDMVQTEVGRDALKWTCVSLSQEQVDEFYDVHRRLLEAWTGTISR